MTQELRRTHHDSAQPQNTQPGAELTTWTPWVETGKLKIEIKNRKLQDTL
jgi:hypothetical protein